MVESDKASVEVPSTVAGTIERILIQSGDSIKEGVVLIEVKTAVTAASEATAVEQAPTQTANTSAPAAAAVVPVAAGLVEVTVPDLGVDKATVSEILVKVGDHVAAQQSLCVVESDKASVEVPSTVAGIITAIHISLGQALTQGTALVAIESESVQPAAPATAAPVATRRPHAPPTGVGPEILPDRLPARHPLPHDRGVHNCPATKGAGSGQARPFAAL